MLALNLKVLEDNYINTRIPSFRDLQLNEFYTSEVEQSHANGKINDDNKKNIEIILYFRQMPIKVQLIKIIRMTMISKMINIHIAHIVVYID